MKTNAGFTLLEVMIALTIFTAMALTISQSASQSVDTLLYLQDKTLASMVAENHMVELKLNGVPRVGERNDQVRFANREWQLHSRVEKTQFPDVNRITLQVADSQRKDNSLVTLVTIMGKQ
ncbi:MAG: type II secretion system minor pseudopilin GspI [Venatoribacter sp.]